ncbi:MAG: N-acetyltransferase family protein [Rhizomicrobium sp.]
MNALVIRDARSGDVALVMEFIRALADYERLAHDVVTNEDEIAAALFAPQPRVFCDIAEWNGEAAGFAVWFYNFSTFRGRHGIYLEDLFVKPDFRGHGIGKGLLANLARRAVEQNCVRVEWSVLDWNKPSIDFYEGIGARPVNGWYVYRLQDAALKKLGGG